MNITPYQKQELIEFLEEDITNEWLALHSEITFDDKTRTITLKIDNIDEQSYGFLK